MPDPIYHDQPIPRRGALPPAPDCPPRIVEMQRVALKLTLRAPAARIFFEQARLMADYEDDRPWRGGLHRHHPTYTSLTLAQLRGYFTWRARLRRGIVEPAPQPFAFLYMQELLHLVGADTAETGFRALLDFRRAYRRLDFGITPFCRMWLADFVVYYDLDAALLAEIPDPGETRPDGTETGRLLPLVCRRDHPPEAIGRALQDLATHNLADSPTLATLPEAFAAALGRAFAAVMDEREWQNPGGAFLGEWQSAPYELFKGAVFFDHLARDQYCRNTPEGRFFCEQGRWRRERFFPYRGKAQREQRKLLAALVRAVDARMRRLWNLKPALKAPNLPEGWAELVEAAVLAEREEERRREALRLPLDLSRLAGIRAEADKTRDSLIVPGGVEDGESEECGEWSVECGVWSEECEGKGSPPVIPRRAAGPTWESRPCPELEIATAAARPRNDNSTPLNAPERALLLALLADAAPPPAPPGQSLALLVDAINEKLFDAFDDTVVVFGESGPRVPEEYHAALRTLLDHA